MPKYEIQIEDSYTETLVTLAEARKASIPDLIQTMVVEVLQQQQDPEITEEFRRLVEESLTENEPVLRRLAQ